MLIEKKAYAKINLYLEILDKLPNGYHSIFTVMQKISLCDDIKININPGAGQNINITCDDKSIPADKTNTVYQAAELFFERTKISAGITIEITKKIPSQAGLGGGSSDAAAVLSGLNEYYDFILPEYVLIDIAAKVGADVPFFVKDANCAVCEGIGEIVTPVEIDTDLSGFVCLIVKPAYNISTKQAFEDWDKSKPPRQRWQHGVFTGWSFIHNDFSELIFSQNQDIREIKDFMIKSNAATAELSGSGSALFGIFGNINDARRCKNAINKHGDIEFCDIFDFYVDII